MLSVQVRLTIYNGAVSFDFRSSWEEFGFDEQLWWMYTEKSKNFKLNVKLCEVNEDIFIVSMHAKANVCI